MSCLQERLHHLETAGRQMLAAAGDGDWGRAGELQAHCQAGAEQLFREAIPPADLAAVASVVRELLALHEQATQLCVASREQSMQALEAHNHGRQAISAYTENSK